MLNIESILCFMKPINSFSLFFVFKYFINIMLINIVSEANCHPLPSSTIWTRWNGWRCTGLTCTQFWWVFRLLYKTMLTDLFTKYFFSDNLDSLYFVLYFICGLYYRQINWIKCKYNLKMNSVTVLILDAVSAIRISFNINCHFYVL